MPKQIHSGHKLPLRPTPTRWFETFTPRTQTVHAIDALTRTGLTQLDGSLEHTRPLYIGKIKENIREFDKLYKKYARYLPAPEQFPATMIMTPEEEAERALTLIREFASNLGGSQEQLAEQDRKLANLHLLNEYLDSMPDDQGVLTRVSHTTEFLYKNIFACAKHGPETVPDTIICETSHSDVHDFYTVADLPNKTADIDNFVSANDCIHIEVPEWLSEDITRQRSQLREAITDLESVTKNQGENLYSSQTDRDLGASITNIALLKWYIDKPGVKDINSKLCHITGWAMTDDIQLLQDALDEINIDTVIRFTEPPSGVEAPVSLIQSWWSKPFHIFVHMMGTPGSKEIDPSFVLPLIIPLLFGYMFPDVGHGIVLALLGLVLFRRWPTVRFLVPCGIVASMFGVLFGEVFGRHDIIPPLWVQPLDHPILILIAPMIFGIFLMLLGLLFNGIEALWRNELSTWILSEAAIIVLYASAVLTIFFPVFAWFIITSLVWYLLGSLLINKGRRLAGFIQSVGTLIVSVMELALNTLSFVRVGAFALAHAALTAGILTITSNIEDNLTRIVILVTLHGLLIVGEGFIVFVQTIRLVLFEFFIRFLHSEGRIFQPSNRAIETMKE